MAITSRLENRSSGTVDLEQVISSMKSNDRSGSALVVGRVQAMTWSQLFERWLALTRG